MGLWFFHKKRLIVLLSSMNANEDHKRKTIHNDYLDNLSILL